MARLTWEELEEVTRRDGLRRFCAEPTADATAADTAATGSKGLCLVLGSEGQGLSDVALRTCEPVAIPHAVGRWRVSTWPSRAGSFILDATRVVTLLSIIHHIVANLRNREGSRIPLRR